MAVSVAVKNATTTIGEGPHWEEKTQTLVYVDIMSGDVHRWNPVTHKDEKVHFDDPVSFVIPRTQGGYVIGLGRKIASFEWDNPSEISVYGEVDQGTKNRFNDAKCDRTGRLWAGTMGHEPKPAEPEMGMGSLYSLAKDGTITSHVSKLDISNGLAWNKDDTVMYFIDSIPRKVYAFDFDKETGEIKNQRTAIDFNAIGPIEDIGLPDGMCIDTEGNLWVACYSVGKVIRFDPETGKDLKTINFPAKRTTSCCFGGKDYDILYVTCARLGVSDEEFKSSENLAGSVFTVTGLGVKGFPGVEFTG